MCLAGVGYKGRTGPGKMLALDDLRQDTIQMGTSVLSNASWKAVPGEARFRKEPSVAYGSPWRWGFRTGTSKGPFRDFSLYVEFDGNLAITKALSKFCILHLLGTSCCGQKKTQILPLAHRAPMTSLPQHLLPPTPCSASTWRPEP